MVLKMLPIYLRQDLRLDCSVTVRKLSRKGLVLQTFLQILGIGRISYPCLRATSCEYPPATYICTHVKGFCICANIFFKDITAEQRRKLDKYITLFNHGP